MNIYKAHVVEIKPNLDIKVDIEIWPGTLKGEKLALKGIEIPPERSKEAKAMAAHIINIVKQTRYLAIRITKKNSKLRYLTDFYYLAGEKNPEKIAANGRWLNKELLELDLAQPYDAKKHAIDFTKKSITAFDEEIDLVTGNFKAEVCMYINDCKQYLRAALEGRPVDMMAEEFDPTDEEYLIIYGLKEVKDMAMQLARSNPLDWKGN